MDRPPAGAVPAQWLGFLDLIPLYLLDGSTSSRDHIMTFFEAAARHLTARDLPTAATVLELKQAVGDGHLTLRGMTPLYKLTPTNDLRKKRILTPLYAADGTNDLTATKSDLTSKRNFTTNLTFTSDLTSQLPADESLPSNIDNHPAFTDDIINNIPSHMWRGPTSFNKTAFWLADVAEDIAHNNMTGAGLLLEAAAKFNSAPGVSK